MPHKTEPPHLKRRRDAIIKLLRDKAEEAQRLALALKARADNLAEPVGDSPDDALLSAIFDLELLLKNANLAHAADLALRYAVDATAEDLT